jgi:type I restriction-modification system DNA methylase subunit
MDFSRKIDRDELREIFQCPFDPGIWKSLLIQVFGANKMRNEPEQLDLDNGENAKVRGYKLGEIITSDKYTIGLFQFEIKSGHKIPMNRVGLRGLVEKEIKYFYDAALVVYYNDDQWRLSFICDMKGEKTAPKRFTYVFGDPAQSYRTPISRFEFIKSKGALKDVIHEAFSVEALNKEFYSFIAKRFYELVGATTGAGKNKTEHKRIMRLPDEQVNLVYQEFAVRMIGRTVFCWFLKEKKSDGGVPLFPTALLSSKSLETYSDYYHTILERIFFQTLNTPMEERVNGLPKGCELIPFLNGGLFDYRPHDFYVPEEGGLSKFRDDVQIPDQWFAALFSELEQYNFTIDENSPDDIEVSVDPEMLGRIFENLLAEIDPDSGETARKATGSFYTPREIVDYMAVESLVYYLNQKTDIDKEAIHTLFKSTEVSEFTQEQREKLLIALDELKILDPACGSGAFPMGVLAKITGVLQILDKDAVWWKQRQIERIDNAAVRQHIQKKLDTATVEYARKIGVIQNTLYGVDIQPIAAEISKLRCFLTLIVDENVDDGKPNRGVDPLPNLEFKFVTANSLMKLPPTTDFGGLFADNTHEAVKKLRQLRIDYMQSYGKEKQRIKFEYLTIQHNLGTANASGSFIDHNSREYLISNWNPFANDASDWFDPKWMFDVTDGFNIVIGNPPYISAPAQEKSPHLKAQRQKLKEGKNYKSLHQKWDLYIPFIELGLQSLRANGFVSMIVPYPVTNQTYGLKIREMMAGENNLVEVTDLNGTKVFENATVSNVIIFVEKAKPQNDIAISHIDKQKVLARSFFKASEDLVQDKQTGVWNLTQEKRETDRYAGMPVFGDFCYISVGMVVNADEKTEKGAFAKEDLIRDTQDDIHSRRYIEAKDIEKYRVKRVRFLEWDTDRCPDKLRRPTFRELYEPTRLVMNCLGKINATLDDGDKLLHNHSIYCAVR